MKKTSEYIKFYKQTEYLRYEEIVIVDDFFVRGPKQRSTYCTKMQKRNTIDALPVFHNFVM